MRINDTDWMNRSDASLGQQMFRKADRDGDGAISKEEFGTLGAGRRSERAGGGLNIDELFSRIDTDGSGTIDEAENGSFLASMEGQRPRNHVAQHSLTYGRDGSPVSEEADARFSYSV